MGIDGMPKEWIPPVPSMCEYSCSPEVANFNFYVEKDIN
jgi:hypothetical protein